MQRVSVISGYSKEKNLIKLLREASWRKLKKRRRRGLRRFYEINFAGYYIYEKPPCAGAVRINITVSTVPPDRSQFSISGYVHPPGERGQSFFNVIKEKFKYITFCGYYLNDRTLKELSDDDWAYKCIIETKD